MKTTAVRSGGIGLCGWIFLVLFTLKLLGKISVSWWIVTLPLWGPLAFLGVIFVLALTWVFVEDKRF